MSRQPLEISPQALFRYQWVAEIETRVLAGEGLREAITRVRDQPCRDEQGRLRRPSVGTLYRWVAAYRAAGLPGLEPEERLRVAASQVLSPELLRLLRRAKAEDEEISVPDLIALARQAGVLGAEERICRTTVWRACRPMGLPLRRAHVLATADTRRFAYPDRLARRHFRADGLRP